MGKGQAENGGNPNLAEWCAVNGENTQLEAANGGSEK